MVWFYLKWYAINYFNAAVIEFINLIRVIGQQFDLGDVEAFQDICGYCIVAIICLKT